MIVAVSSQYIRRPWCIDRQRSSRNATGWTFRITVAGEYRMPEAQSLGEALKKVQKMTEEGER